MCSESYGGHLARFWSTAIKAKHSHNAHYFSISEVFTLIFFYTFNRLNIIARGSAKRNKTRKIRVRVCVVRVKNKRLLKSLNFHVCTTTKSQYTILRCDMLKLVTLIIAYTYVTHEEFGGTTYNSQ